MPRVVHFELPADDVERAVSFYTDVFGWSIKKWDGPEPYWLINTGEDCMGINGGLMKRQYPDQPVVNVIGVSDIDAYVQKVTEAGGTVAVPKMVVPDVGYLAYCKDPEGNLFGIIQPLAGEM